MNDWQSTYLGRGALPRDLSGFEIEAFFTYCESERRVIDDERRTPTLKIALALQIGFLRMTGRLLEALRMVPPALWRHLGTQFHIEAPDLARCARCTAAAARCSSIRTWPVLYWGFIVSPERSDARWYGRLTLSYHAPVIASDCCSLRVDGSTG